jgi:tetratricopeptide (TPR) repeat protein
VDRPGLTLVGDPRRPRARQPRRALVLGIAAAVLGSGTAATVVGVDTARNPVEPREMARRALGLSLELGSDDSQVRGMLLELRSSLGRRPLDSSTRVVYAALLLNLGRRLADHRAAAYHALRAAQLAPVTVPVQRLSTLTLARTGDASLALARIREMFGYDPPAAARLLTEVEPLVEPNVLEEGLAGDPEAWFAWAAQLRRVGRLDEAYAWNERTRQRWADHLPTLRFVAARQVRDNDWDALERLLPADGSLSAVPEASPLLLYRARLKTTRGDPAGALEDIRRALALAGESNLTQILAGEAFEALGDYTAARRHWNRALFDVPADETATRRNVLAQLARLEERHGRPSAAVRLWESVLELEPSHAEAARRIRALTDFDRR